MKQVALLRLAKRELGLTYAGLAQALGVSERAVEKWALDPASQDHREMPLMARKFLALLLDGPRRRLLAAGDRAAVERLDAIAAQCDPDRMRDALRGFDALQRAANALAPMRARRARPRHFATWREKSAWEEQEQVDDARRARAKSARRR